MSFDELRPILSGLIGGALVIALSSSLAKWVPKSFQGKSADQLLLENRSAIRCADILSSIGMLGAFALYQWGGFSWNDWRPLALGFGLTFSAPVIALPLYAIAVRRRAIEVFIAYAQAKKMPLPMLFTLCPLGIPLLLFSMWKLQP
jgi:hypothetical protein